MRADFVSLLAIGISFSLHLSLLLLNDGEPARAQASSEHSSSSSIVVTLAEKNAEPVDIPHTAQPDNATKDVHATGHENSSTGGADPTTKAAATITEETYFVLNELEEAPRILEDIDQNPANLETYAQGGRVVLQLWIDEQGNVVDQELVESMLPSAFVNSAMESFAQAKFIAGVKYGRPVKSTVKVVINYDPLVS